MWRRSSAFEIAGIRKIASQGVLEKLGSRHAVCCRYALDFPPGLGGDVGREFDRFVAHAPIIAPIWLAGKPLGIVAQLPRHRRVSVQHRQRHDRKGLGRSQRKRQARDSLGAPPVPAYLVRLIKDRDIVGFFAAEDFNDLLLAVDECTDASAREYV